MTNLQKNYLNMVLYSLAGVVVGAVIAVAFGYILDFFYQTSPTGFPGFRNFPPVPAAGGVIGGVLSAVMVIKFSKNEKE